MITKAILSKLSVCDCGFPLLDESIPIGTEYEVEPDDIVPFKMICGGCNKMLSLDCIFVFARGASHAGWLPKDAFSITTTTTKC